jgi:hypothetical protein
LARFKALEAKQNSIFKQSQLSAKRKRGYHRIMSGLSKAQKLGIPLIRLDLTLRDNYLANQLSPMYQALRKRILRHKRIKINYVCVKARGDKGGKYHLHLVYWASTLKNKPIFDVKQLRINKYWLSNAWEQISGSKITFIRMVRGRLANRKISNYMVSQYFSGQNSYERMSYSGAWLFRGAVTIWKLCFRPIYEEAKQFALDSWLYLLTHQTALAVVNSNG